MFQAGNVSSRIVHADKVYLLLREVRERDRRIAMVVLDQHGHISNGSLDMVFC